MHKVKFTGLARSKLFDGLAEQAETTIERPGRLSVAKSGMLATLQPTKYGGAMRAHACCS
jgi:hypothetical protein